MGNRKNPVALGAKLVSERWRLALGIYAIIVCIGLLPAWLLLFAAETLSGRLAGLIPVLLAAWIPSLLILRRTRHLIWIPILIVGFIALGSSAMLVMTPDGQTPPDAPVRSVFLKGEFDRWSVANVVPEVDQLKLGTYLVPFVDPFIDRAQAARLRGLVLDQYRDMNEDQAFPPLGSVMGFAYADRDVGHLYVFAPPGGTSNRPVLIFLHGSGGSFKAYFHIFYELAKGQNMVLVCPSFGFGNWHQAGGVEAIDRAYEYATGPLGGSPDRVYLAALSNGGRGATRALAAHPDRYAGVVFVSAVMEPLIIGSARHDGTPTLVFHGAKDRRIPMTYADLGIQALRSAGADVTVRVWPGEDHFLLFSQEPAVREEIVGWMLSVSSN